MKHILTAILTAIASIAYATAQTDSVAIADTSKDTDIATAAEPAPGLLAQQADSAYAQDNFALAERLYLESIKQDGTSSTIFYNLGNAYYRQGNLGKAIVNYERALKLDPTNADARDNLDFVKAKITDRQIDEGSIMTKLWHNVISTFKADTWAWIAVILFALFLAGAFTYMLSSVILIKKISFFGGMIIFMLCALTIIISFAAANRVTDNRYAIIPPPSAQLSTPPREARTQAEEAFLLHEGTKVEIVDSISGSSGEKWYEVKVGGRERAWIKASETERI